MYFNVIGLALFFINDSQNTKSKFDQVIMIVLCLFVLFLKKILTNLFEKRLAKIVSGLIQIIFSVIRIRTLKKYIDADPDSHGSAAAKLIKIAKKF